MASSATGTTRLYLRQDMQEADRLDLDLGDAAVVSRKSPAKDSDNEDAAAVIRLSGERVVLAVADGMGGLPAGGQASGTALGEFVRAVEAAAEAGTGLREAMLDGFEAANHAVMAMGSGAGTTLAAVEIDGASMRSYHVGDSAVLLVGQRGKLKHMTIAHSPVGYAVEAGLLDEEQAMGHADRHVVSNSLGSREMKIEIGPTLRLADRDTLLLASDGLFDNLRQEEIVGLVRKGPLGAAARALAERCRERMTGIDGEPQKPDDLTFVIYRRRP